MGRGDKVKEKKPN